MIRTLVIACSENAGLIDRLKNIEMDKPRKLIGDNFSLMAFLQSDMKKYMAQTHFLLDVSAIEEKDDEFIKLVGGINLLNDKARVIIFSSVHYAGDEFLHKLVASGYTNIVTNYDVNNEKENYKLMLKDLSECFSLDGLSQKTYRRYDMNYQAQIKGFIEEPSDDYIDRNIKVMI